MRNQFEKKKWNKMLRDKIKRKQNRPWYGKKIVKRMSTIFDIKTKQNQMKKEWNWKKI